MKKVFLSFAVVAMMAVVSCKDANTETPAEEANVEMTEANADATIETVEAEADAMVDSTKAVEEMKVEQAKDAAKQ
ncbi:hypothetical protein [Flavobacterium ardleyense]|uniref:hypothetical protein n=1 Tax=Flavobacterium ardleyense TaxID=2038737 RepID=UPI00298C7D12|nr:hypothetical protein [Flavobacterium ardleyense]